MAFSDYQTVLTSHLVKRYNKSLRTVVELERVGGKLEIDLQELETEKKELLAQQENLEWRVAANQMIDDDLALDEGDLGAEETGPGKVAADVLDNKEGKDSFLCRLRLYFEP